MALGILFEILLFVTSLGVLEYLALAVVPVNLDGGIVPESVVLIKAITVPASLLLVAALLRLRGERLHDIGCARPQIGWSKAVRLGVFFTFPMLLFSVAITAAFSEWFGGGNRAEFDLNGAWALPAFFAVGVLAGGIPEEIQFRGYLFRRFEQLFLLWGKVAQMETGATSKRARKMASLRAIWISSLVFAGLHSYQGVAAMAAIFLVAMALQFLFLYSGRNLIAGMVCHSLFNGVQITFLWLAASA